MQKIRTEGKNIIIKGGNIIRLKEVSFSDPENLQITASGTGEPMNAGHIFHVFQMKVAVKPL